MWKVIKRLLKSCPKSGVNLAKIQGTAKLTLRLRRKIVIQLESFIESSGFPIGENY
jgi:hypothetical protein